MEMDTDVAEMSDDELLNFSLDDPIPKRKTRPINAKRRNEVPVECRSIK